MRRIIPAFVAGAILGLAGIAVAAPAVYDQLWGDRVDERLCDIEAEVGIESVECVTTTTTSQPTTTTTEAVTTTTQPPTTTTEPPSGLVIPPTEPYPTNGLKDDGGYDIIASNADTGVTWWTAPYWGSGGLSAYPGGGAWIDGDRQGYSCGYGFVVDSADEIVGRFAFVRAPGQTYGKVNDRYMSEGVRYLDGSPRGPQEVGNEIDENCHNVLSDIDYEGACRPVDERPRVAFFDTDGNVLDIRDYSNTAANNVAFNLHSFDGTRATVIACEDGLVGMIVYYDALGDGQIAVELP